MTEKKGLSSMLIMLLVASLFVVGTVAAVCVDNDQSNDPFVKGRISSDTKTIQGGVQWDSCKDPATLIERTCAGDQILACPHGCADGACKSYGKPAQQMAQCFDSDPDDDPYIVGSISQGKEATAISKDYCMDNKKLFEQNCFGGKVVNCDLSCTEGKCNVHGKPGQKQTQCLDTDSGQDFYVKGIVSYGGAVADILYDYCQSNSELIEQTCSGPVKVVCQRSCADGLCTGPKVELTSQPVVSTAKVLPQPPQPAAEEAPAAPEAAPAAPAPQAPAEEAGSKTLLWVVIIVVLIAIIYLSTTKKGEKKKGK